MYVLCSTPHAASAAGPYHHPTTQMTRCIQPKNVLNRLSNRIENFLWGVFDDNSWILSPVLHKIYVVASIRGASIITLNIYFTEKQEQPPNRLLNNITKTCLYNFDPLKPHFYIVKLGFTGAIHYFSCFAKNIDCGYSLWVLVEAVLTSTHNLCFENKYEKYQNLNFYLEIFLCLVVKFLIYSNRRLFVKPYEKKVKTAQNTHISLRVT